VQKFFSNSFKTLEQSEPLKHCTLRHFIKPFTLKICWYYHEQFWGVRREEGKGVTQQTYLMGNSRAHFWPHHLIL